MSDLYDQIAADRGASLDIVSARKRESVAAATEAKRQAGFTQFNPDEWNVIDTDTLAHKTRKNKNGYAETMRLGFEEEGYSFDAFETRKHSIEEGQPGHDPYFDNPGKADFHRRAYARQLGKKVEDVSNEDLYDAGTAQTQRLKDNIESLRGQNYTAVSGADKYGRVLGKFADNRAFDEISGGVNAGFRSKFNSKRRMEDGFKPAALKERSIARALTGDAAVSALSGGANAANGLAYFMSILARAKPGVMGTAAKQHAPELNEIYKGTKAGIKEVSDVFSSDAKVQREAFDAKEQEFLAPLYKARKEQYMSDDIALEEWQASLLATKDEYADRLEYLAENPGRILDAGFESVPYMLGIGTVGKLAANSAASMLSRKTLGALAAKGVGKGEAAARTAEYMASKAAKELIDKTVSRAGVSAVAVTEAAMNSAEVYSQVSELSEAQLSKSEEFMKLRNKGMSFEDARERMAKLGFQKTFAANFALAFVASKVTGAGDWEANLIRGMGEASTRGIVKSVGNTVGQAAISGGREFLEESAQSGGGELISQVFSEEATGKEVGQGIGAATAEGGLTGLASGAGISAVSGTAKDVLRAGQAVGESLSKSSTRLSPAATRVQISEEGSVHAGGSVADIDAQIKEGKLNGSYTTETAVAAVREILDLADADTKADRPTLRLVKQLNRHYAEVKNGLTGQAAKDLKQRVGKYNDEYRLALKADMDKLHKSVQDREITIEQIENDPATKAMLVEAQMVLEDGSTGLESPKLGKFLSSAKVVKEKVAAAIKSAGANTTLAPKGDLKDIERVNDEKMGSGTFKVNGKTVLGLQAHVEAITEAINSGDTTEYRTRDGKLRNFLNSQATKLRAYKEILDRVNDPEDKADPATISSEVSKKYHVKVQYEPSVEGQVTGTAALIKVIGDELVTMGEVRQALGEMAASELSGIENAATRNAVNEPASGKITLDEIKAVVEETVPAAEATAEAAVEETLSEDAESAVDSAQSAATADQQVSVADEDKDSEPAGIDALPDGEPEATPSSEGEPEASPRARARPESKDEGVSDPKAEPEVKETPEDAAEAQPQAAPEKKTTITVLPFNTIWDAHKAGKGIATIRRPGDKHLGNPFGVTGKNTQAAVPNAGTGAEVTARYRGWLLGKNDHQVEPERREWIVSQILSGNLDGKELLYFQDTEVNHAKALADIINDKDELVERSADAAQQRLAEGGPVEQDSAPEQTQEYIDTHSEAYEETETIFPPNAGAAMETPPPMDEADIPEYTDEEMENRAPADYVSDGLDSLPDDPNAPDDTELAVEEEDAAPGDPVASEADTGPNPDLDEGLVQEYRKAIYQLNNIIAEAGSLIASQVRLDNTSVTGMLKAQINKHDGDIAAAAQFVINHLVTKVDNENNDIQRSPGERAPAEQEQALVEAAETLIEGKKLKPGIINRLKNSVDFMSAKVVPYISPLVGVFGDPTIAWTDKKLASTRKLLREKFKKLGLPTQIRKAIKDKNTRVKNILNAVPGVMTTLQKQASRITFFNTVSATIKERQGMNGVIDFSTEFMNVLSKLNLGLLETADKSATDKGNKNTTFKRTNLDDKKEAISNPLEEYLFQFLLEAGLDPNGEEASIIQEQIAAIMAVESAAWLASGGASTLNNHDSVINGLLSKNETDTIPDEVRKVLGNGTLHTNVARQLGAKVVKEMNFSIDSTMEELTPSFKDALEVSIGLMMTATLAEMNRVEIVPVGDFIARHGEDANSDAEINLIYAMPKDPTATNGDQYTVSNNNEQLRIDFQSAGRILRDFFSVVEYRRGPSLTKVDAPTTVAGGFAKIPKKQQRNIKANSDIPVRPIKAMVNEMNRWKSTLFQEQVMGSQTQEEIDTTVHTGDAKFAGADGSAASKNARNKRSYEQMRDWIAQNGFKPFYFAYNMISSHRIMIDSNTINLQADSTHRFFFGMKEWDVTMKSTSLNPKSAEHIARLNAFKVAVALSLDIDTEGNFTESQVGLKDKNGNPHKGIIELFDDMIQDPAIRAALDIMRTNPDTYTEAEQLTIGQAIAIGGEGTHTLAGLRAWADFEQASAEGKRTVKVTIPMEVDGKTNGYASLLMQFAPRTEAERKALEPFYNAVGVFFKDGEYQSYAEYIQLGNGQDNYNGVTGRSSTKVDEMRDGDIPVVIGDPVYLNEEQAAILKHLRENALWKTEDGRLGYRDQKAEYVAANIAFQKSTGVLSVLASGFVELNRAFAKGPLTQVAYSASMGSVRRGLRKLAVSNFYTELAKAGSEHALLDKDGNDITNIEDVRAAIIDVLVRQTAVISAYNGNSEADTAALIEFNTKRMEKFTTHDALINFRRTYVMSKAASESFQGGIDLVYGHSLQSALEERLEVIVAMTKDMNDSVYAANLIFTHDFRRRIAHREETEGTLTDGQRKQIIQQMIREGLVPSVKTPMSQTQLDSLETTSMGTVTLAGETQNDSLKGRAYFDGARQIHARGYDAAGNPIQPPKQDSSVSALTGVDPNMNIGVAAIAKSTHSVDGSVNGDVMGKFPILNLFDASFGNFETIVDTGTYANQRFWDHHKEWNMGQSFFESLERMLPLIAPDDSRLSKSDKIAIIGLFQEQRQGFSNADHEQDAQTHFEEWLDQFRKGINNNNEAREALFAEIASINQFAKEDTVFSVPADDQGAVNPKTAAIVSKTSWASGLIGVIRGDEANIVSHVKQKIITELRDQIKYHGDSRQTLNNWMDSTGGPGHAPNAEDMLDVLYAVYADQTKTPADAERFAQIINTIRPMLSSGRPVRIKLAAAKSLINPENNQEDDGRFETDSGTVWISDEARDPIGTLLHEIVHAANVRQLERLGTAENKDRFNDLLADAKSWATKHLKDQTSTPERRAAMAIVAALTSKKDASDTEASHKLRQEVFAISEYAAHLNGELRWKQGKFDFHFYSQGDVQTASKALSDTVQTPKGQHVYYSSSDEVTDSLFSEEQGEMLTKDNLTTILGRLRETETLPTALQQLFTHLIEGVLTEGLTSIDSVIYKMANSPTGRNVGKVLVEAGEATVYVQATEGNVNTSSNVEMSAQEVAIHEILHAIFAWAIDNNPSVQNQVDKLFDRTLNALEETYDGNENVWKAFLPQDSAGNYLPGTDPALDEKLARERFEHIFGDPTAGKDANDFLIAEDPAFPTDKEIKASEQALAQSGNQGKHEFMALGISNPQFIKILQGTEQVKPGPIWRSGELIASFHRLLTKVMNTLKGEIFNDHKTDVHTGLENLSKKIIAFNTKQQILAKNREDEGSISKRINGLNNFAVNKLAGLVNTKMKTWADENSLATPELRKLQDELGTLASIIATSKSMSASVLNGNMEKFRDALDAAVVEKDHMLYEMLTEILPWADRNRSWVDMLRRSEVLIDGRRQQLIEHTRTGLHKFFAAAKDYTPAEREAITNVVLKTDLTALMQGDIVGALDIGQVLDLLENRESLDDRIKIFEAHLSRLVGPRTANAFNKQSKGLASYMVHGLIQEWMQQLNIYGIVTERFRDKQYQTEHENAEEITEVLEHLTSMRALALLDRRTVAVVSKIMTKEVNRGVEMNGFNGMMGMAQSFKQESQAKLFRGNPSQMIKGYVYEILDEEVSIEAKAYTTPEHRDRVIAEQKRKGWTWVEDLARDEFDNNPAKMMLFKQERGIPTYSKSYMSLTGEQMRGTGLYDSLFLTADENQASNVTAARAHGMLARTTADALRAGEAQFDSALTRKGVKMVPVYNENDEITDFRYIMSEENKKKHLKKRDFFDEVLPRMFASIEDRVNTKTINEEGIDLLYEEWVDETNKEDSEARFVEIGRDVATEEGREMWSLLPKATRLHVEKTFGAELFYVRDETVNLVLGFRKMSLAKAEVLAPISPAVRIAEKIWQEIIQWERFRIAVLNPVVVIGNVVSNIAMLLSQGITPAYIWRMAKVAIVGMRKYQKELRLRNELQLDIQASQGLNKDTRAKEAQLARLNANLNNNPVRDLVEEGLFTSIVEEFGVDENSTRKKLANKVTNKFGKVTGSQTVVKVASEAMMVPGSELANMALMATQYGDFVGRFVKFNWDTKVGRKVKGYSKENRIKADNLSEAIRTNLIIRRGIIDAHASSLEAAKAKHAEDSRFTIAPELFGPAPTEAIDNQILELRRALTKVPQTVNRVLVERTKAIHESLDSFIYYNIPQNRVLQYMNDNGLMMFTKFFFRIQPIIGRTFKRNPVQSAITLGLQHSLQSRSAEENIANYAFMAGGSRKFDLTPWDRITNGEIFEITALKWIPDIFWKD